MDEAGHGVPDDRNGRPYAEAIPIDSRSWKAGRNRPIRGGMGAAIGWPVPEKWRRMGGHCVFGL